MGPRSAIELPYIDSHLMIFAGLLGAGYPEVTRARLLGAVLRYGFRATQLE